MYMRRNPDLSATGSVIVVVVVRWEQVSVSQQLGIIEKGQI